MKKNLLLLLTVFTMFITGCGPTPDINPPIFTDEEQSLYTDYYNTLRSDMAEYFTFTSIINGTTLEFTGTCIKEFNPEPGMIFHVGDAIREGIKKVNGQYIQFDYINGVPQPDGTPANTLVALLDVDNNTVFTTEDQTIFTDYYNSSLSEVAVYFDFTSLINGTTLEFTAICKQEFNPEPDVTFHVGDIYKLEIKKVNGQYIRNEYINGVLEYTGSNTTLALLLND